MKKPAAETPAVLGELVKSEMSARGFTSNMKFGKAAQVCPGTVKMVCEGTFPGKMKGNSNLAATRIKFLKGRTQSLARICDTLGLDMSSCFAACGLEMDKLWVQEALATTRPTVLTRQDIDALGTIIDVTGPMPLETALQTLALIQKRREMG